MATWREANLSNMKIFFSESRNDYSTYTFSYAIYSVKETQTELPDIYNKGFLPYTSNPSIEPEVYYLCRSLRVDLERFEDSSENRRVNRKVEELNVQLDLLPKTEFDCDHPAFLHFCLDYAADRFSNSAMNENRFRYILNRESASHLFRFQSEGRLLGYVLAVIEGKMLHYWYAFFDTQFMESHSIGKWMMWRVIRWAKDQGLAHVYLGTCYGKHSLYKVRDHKGLEFFDGSGWNADMKLLKDLCNTDAEPPASDRFKLLTNQNSFITAL